ncbi:hypothetical protein [Teredinibacter turnerae]|uniref:hypothetical protein n=1 Tax=Teredinibacter turnerae TaxID=2426 RepID=UPI0005F8562F|nr:hypothetical protein [Teredinibacter turnerae]
MSFLDDLKGGDSDPYLKWAQTLIGGYVAVEQAKRPAPAAPQPDSANSYQQTPTQPQYAPTGADAGVVNTVNAGGVNIGGMSVGKTALGVSAAVLLTFGVVALMR